jgi:acetylglutamate kinase
LTKLPKGFRFAGVHAGIKPIRKDLALIVSEKDAALAACLTLNAAAAAPVIDCRPRTPYARARAIVINSGNANALTGKVGLEDVRQVHGAVAKALKLEAEQVFSASTGVIGVRLPIEKVLGGVPSLVAMLDANCEPAAQAIMTTDTRQKVFSRTLVLSGKDVVISAIAKGSGMIAPSLATMIAVITTDAAITPVALQHALEAAMTSSFNALTVDGDMSTNDVVFALANGMAKNDKIDPRHADYKAFAQALASLCEDIAREIAADGEGATKLLQVQVTHAPTTAIAVDLARAVCGSPLVKAAIFGADPNWGRVLATVGARVGTEGYSVVPYEAKVTIQNLVVYDRGPASADMKKLRQGMRESEIQVEVDLRAGDASGKAYGCDLSYDYVKINGDYTSLIVQDEEGCAKKDDRLTNYSPKFKVSLLVEALSYISKLEGKRVVIKYGGAAMVQDGLKRSFCEDIELLRSVGVRPIIVHGGGPEITKTLARLGNKSEFVDGMRVTNADDMRVVEMVLSGSVNADIVTLLNARSKVAFGMSGKDGALLRAKKLLSDEGRDLGLVGEVDEVDASSLEMLLAKDYVPVISPVGLGPDGQSYNINADNAAAAIATALGAQKLIYVTDVAGLLRNGDLVTEIDHDALRAWLEDPEGGIKGGMKVKVQSILRALRKGVSDVHIIDGRTPHSLIAELFTDSGIGTWVKPSAAPGAVS